MTGCLLWIPGADRDDGEADPWWLILLPLILPPLVLVSYQQPGGLGPVRRVLAILFRASVITLIVLALAEVQSVRTTDRLTTMFLIDASKSIPKESQKAALDYVTEESKKRRQGRPGRRGRLRPRAPGRGPARADRAEPDWGSRTRSTREHRPRRGRQAGPGHLPRGHRAADRRALRRQREPRQPAGAGPGRQGAGRAGRRPADRLLLRQGSPGREGLDPARREEGGDGQHQRRGPRQRADQRDAPDLPEVRRRAASRPPATRSRCRSSSTAASTSSRSSSSSPSRTSTPSPPSSSPTKGSGDRRAINNVAEGFTYARRARPRSS